MHVHKEGKRQGDCILRRINGPKPTLRQAMSTDGIANSLLGVDVIDKTGVTGRYGFDLQWDRSQPNSIKTAIREQPILELVEEKRTLEHLIVDFIKEPKTW
jgi:uncharacterized protein (TIGR03435 family)